MIELRENEGKMGKEMKDSELCYDAFISYRHTEPDMFVAKELHREMEAFRLPKNVRQKQGDGKRTRIERVFRDRDELPLASNLADPITSALAVSDFLIVICSPRLPQSLWCRKEIQTFVEMHGREHILAVLAEGEPEDAFPEELLYREEIHTKEDGSTISVKVPVEPLAADVRGSNKKEIKKKIKEEVLRLAAPMFECGYDELKQRHKERKLKRMLGAAAVAAAVCFAFGSVSTAMALKIKGQNTEIQNQNQQISEQSKRIEEQYQEARRVNAGLKAQEAFRLLEEGDRIAAIETAKSALPNEAEPDLPYVAEAEYALSESLGVYENGTGIIPAFMLKHETNVNIMKLSPDRNTLLTVDDANKIYLWNVADGKLLAKMDNYISELYISEEQVAFIDNERFACLKNEIRVFDFSGSEMMRRETEGLNVGLFGDGQGKYLFHMTWDEVNVLDAQNLQTLCTVPVEEGMEFERKVTYDAERELLILARKAEQDGEEENPPADVLIIKVSDGEVLARIPLLYENVDKLYLSGGALYILNNSDYENLKNPDGTESFLFYEAKGKVIALDLEEKGKILWQYDSPQNPIKDICVGQSGESDSILLSTGYDLVAIHGKDGSYIGECGVGESVIRLGALVGNERFVVYTRDGRLLTADAETGTVNTIEVAGFYQCNEDNIRELLNGSAGKVLIQPYSSSTVTVMYAIEGNERELFFDKVSGSFVDTESTQEHFLVFSEEKDAVQCLDKEENILWNLQVGEDITDAAFIGENGEKTAVLQDTTVRILDTETGKEIHSYTLDGYFYQVSLAGSMIYQSDGETLNLYDTATGDAVSSTDLTEICQYGDKLDVLPKEGYLAVASDEEKELILYELSTGKKKASAEINVAFTENILCSVMGKDTKEPAIRVYVNYKNDRMECYLWDGGSELIKEHDYGELETQPMELMSDGEHYELLKGISVSYLLKDQEIVARIPDCVKADFAGGYIYTNAFSENKLFRVPIYTCDMLMKYRFV